MATLANSIIWIWFTFWTCWVIWSFSAKKNAGSMSRLRGYIGLRLVIIVLAIAAAHRHYKQAYTFNVNQVSSNKAAVIIGFIVFLLGLGLAIWARLYLGKNWGMPMTKKEEPELVTAGPYSFIRHPIYSGILLAILGTALATSLYWLAIFVIAGSYFTYSATVEEKNMTKQFPKVYPSYKGRTKMLIPFIL